MSEPITDVASILAEIERRLDARPPAGEFGARPHLNRVHCVDGFTVSIQANQFNYCTPREDTGPWWQVELGFPSAPMPALADYIDGDDPNETETVWGYVPLRKVAAMLAEHGGLMPETQP